MDVPLDKLHYPFTCEPHQFNQHELVLTYMFGYETQVCKWSEIENNIYYSLLNFSHMNMQFMIDSLALIGKSNSIGSLEKQKIHV